MEKKMSEDGPKKTTFDSDECQALLDLYDKMQKKIDQCLDSFPFYHITGDIDMTEEEQSVYQKLQEAGELYVPVNNGKS